MTIKISGGRHSVDIDGTKFDVPANKDQRDGLRELVLNYWCEKNGYALLYPDARNKS